jgi:hypothetical protein
MISHTGSSRLGYSTHFLALTQHHPTHSQKHRALPRQHSPKHTHINPIGIVTPSMNVRRSLAATRFISSWGSEEVRFICHSGTACHLHTTYTLPEKKRADAGRFRPFYPALLTYFLLLDTLHTGQMHEASARNSCTQTE